MNLFIRRLFLGVFVLVTSSAQKLERFHSVWTEGGMLKGRIWNIDDRYAQIFRGIPYAEPPVGDLRLKKPVPKKPWQGEKMAMNDGNPCIQFADFYVNDKYAAGNMKLQSEDCLYLNIFAPVAKNGDTTRRYPVMVWVHGGSFLAGSGVTSIDKEAAIKNFVFKGVVLVTLNYRLGALGFMSYKEGAGTLKGNWGLWDIKVALDWIHSNIRAFQGDVTAVTLFGESAGGAAASLLALSPLTKDTIHNVIVMSGSAAAGWALVRNDTKSPPQPQWEAGNIMKYLTCEKQFDPKHFNEVLNTYKLESDSIPCNLVKDEMDCGDAETSEALFECFQSKLFFDDHKFRLALTNELAVAQPVVDGELIPYSVDVLLKNYTRVPIMTGNAFDEWGHKKATYYDFKGQREVGEEEMREMVGKLSVEKFESFYGEDNPATTLHLVSNATFFHYITQHSQKTSWDVLDLVQQLRQLEADAEFHAPCARESEAYAREGLATFVYSFQHTPSSPIYEEEKKMFNLFGHRHPLTLRRELTFRNAFHGLDHAYLFTEGYALNYEFQFNSRERKFADLLTTLFTNFAKYGNPTKKPLEVRPGVEWSWEKFTAEKPQYARLGWSLEMVEGRPKQTDVSFWNQLIPYLSTFAQVDDPTANRYNPLKDDERLQLNAYKRAWWALWLLVAAIALILWTVVICLVAKKCLSPRTKNFNRVIVSNNR